MEGPWSRLRPHRGISQDKLPLYLAFFEFVYNLPAFITAGSPAQKDPKAQADSSYKCTTESKEGTVKNRVGLRLLKPKPTGASRCPTIILPNPIVA